MVSNYLLGALAPWASALTHFQIWETQLVFRISSYCNGGIYSQNHNIHVNAIKWWSYRIGALSFMFAPIFGD